MFDSSDFPPLPLRNRAWMRVTYMPIARDPRVGRPLRGGPAAALKMRERVLSLAFAHKGEGTDRGMRGRLMALFN